MRITLHYDFDHEPCFLAGDLFYINATDSQYTIDIDDSETIGVNALSKLKDKYKKDALEHELNKQLAELGDFVSKMYS